MVFRSTAALHAEVLPHSCFSDASEIPHWALWQNKNPEETESSVLLAVPEQQGWPRNWQHPAAERGLCVLQIVAQKGRTRCFAPFHVAWGNTERDRIQVKMPGCALLTWRGDRRHTENWWQLLHPKHRLPSLPGYFIRNEPATVNER